MSGCPKPKLVNENDVNLAQTTSTSTLENVAPVQAAAEPVINSAPTLTAINTLGPTNEDTSLTITYATLAAAANEADANAGDTIFFRIETISTGTLTKNGAPIIEGTTVLGPGQTIVWTPSTNANGILNAFTVKAWDGSLASNSSVQVLVTTTSVNDNPVISTNTGLTVPEGASGNITNAKLSVSDPDNTTLQRIFTVGTVPANGTLKLNGTTLSATNTFTQDDIDNSRVTFVHNGSSTISDSFSFTVSDTSGGSIASISFAFTITQLNDSPTIIAPPNRVYPLDGTNEPIIQGAAYTFTPSASDEDGDTLTFSCTYETPGMSPSDVNFTVPSTLCTSLPSLVTTNSVLHVSTASFSVSTGALSWRPTNRQKGTYKFTLSVSDGNGGNATANYFVTVRENFTTTNLLSGLDASLSNAIAGLSGSPASCPRLDGDSLDNLDAWLGIISSNNATISAFNSSAPWSGAGTTTSPYKLNFSGTTDKMSFGSVLNGKTKLMFSAWISPSAANTTNKTIITTGGGEGNGFVLKQSGLNPAKLEIAVGKGSYRDLLVADNPVSYWRLGETSSTVATDEMGVNNGTYVGGYTLEQAGAISTDANNSAAFNGSTAYISVNDSPSLSFTNNIFSFDFWIKTDASRTQQVLGKNSPGGPYEYGITTSSGNISISTWSPPGCGYYGGLSVPLDSNWNHISVVATGTELRLYKNGTLAGTTNVPAGGCGNMGDTGSPFHIGSMNYSCWQNWCPNLFQGQLDEVSIFNYALSATQVINHYNAGRNIFAANPLLARGPNGYWKFDETSGPTAIDSSGNNNNGTYDAQVTLGQPSASGKIGDYSASFAWGGAGVTIPTSAALSPKKEMSISVWLKARDSFAGYAAHPVNKWSSTNNANFVLYYFGTTSGVDRALEFLANAGGNWKPISDAQLNISVGQWYHVALSYKSSIGGQLYINGAPVGARTGSGDLAQNNEPILVGKPYFVQEAFPGEIDELAIFDHALSDSNIASLYAASNYFKCESHSSISNGAWTFVSGLWDAGNLRLFMNGREECSINPTTNFAPSTDLFVGGNASGSNFWQGAIADTKFYGTENDSAAGSATEIKSDFDVTANRFRSIPVEEIVTNGLVLNLDASNARNGITPASTGCAAADINWFDLSTSSLMGSLTNFSNCNAATGWIGSGSNVDPYRLKFDGTDDYVKLPTLNISNDITVISWTRVADANQGGFIVQKQPVNQSWELFYEFGAIRWRGGAPYNDNISIAAPPTNVWHQIAATQSGTAAALYVDGALAVSGSHPAIGNSSGAIDIGRHESGYYFNGDISIVQIYDRALPAEEIRQNCHAQKSRFQDVVCFGP